MQHQIYHVLMYLTQWLAQSTSESNRLSLYLFGQIVSRVSTVQRHIIYPNITPPSIDRKETSNQCTGQCQFCIHDILPYPIVHDINGHAVMDIGDAIGSHLRFDKDSFFWITSLPEYSWHSWM